MSKPLLFEEAVKDRARQVWAKQPITYKNTVAHLQPLKLVIVWRGMCVKYTQCVAMACRYE